jgi:Phytochelatin synthase
MQNEQVRQGSQPSRRSWLYLFMVAIGTTMGVAGTLIGVAVMGKPSEAVAQEKKALKLDEGLIALDTDDGQRLLDESKAKQSYVPLSMYFTTQDNLAYCGAASACMVLNATGIERPVSPEHKPFRLFTQTNLFNPKVCEVIAPEKVRKGGMPLKTLGEVLACYPVKVEAVHASETDLPTFRKSAIEVLKSRDSYLVVNYLRKSIKQESGGHISPIAAYHEGEDRFLIMDVSRYKYPPVWVKAEGLWEAMKAVDSDSDKSRGYVIVRHAEK